jgi:hypothetical protein
MSSDNLWLELTKRDKFREKITNAIKKNDIKFFIDNKKEIEKMIDSSSRNPYNLVYCCLINTISYNKLKLFIKLFNIFETDSNVYIKNMFEVSRCTLYRDKNYSKICMFLFNKCNNDINDNENIVNYIASNAKTKYVEQMIEIGRSKFKEFDKYYSCLLKY